MKKIIFYFLFGCFFLNSFCFAESYDLNTFFPIEKNMSNFPVKEEAKAPEEPVKNKKSKKKNKFFNYSTNKQEDIPMGYYGSLPDIEADFKYMQQKTKTSSNNDLKVVEEDAIVDENLKEAPYDDTLFLDNIVKKEPNSQYVNDLNKIRYALSNLKKCLEEEGNIQRFNACVNCVDLYCENLKKKYENKSESLKESYIDILNTNYRAKTLGNLKYNANYYSKYVPTNQGQYSKENIQNQEQKLLARVNKTLLLIMQEE